MPRVKPLIKKDPRETAVLEMIGGTMAVMEITQTELAERAGISPSTMSGRLKHIGEMRLSELWAIQDVRKKAGF
jgi:DNA-binding transcriptional regulator GbsR (MarR family)